MKSVFIESLPYVAFYSYAFLLFLPLRAFEDTTPVAAVSVASSVVRLPSRKRWCLGVSAPERLWRRLGEESLRIAGGVGEVKFL